MSHAHTQLRDAVVTLVTGLTTTGTNVYETRVYPVDTLPGLTVYTDQMVVDADRNVAGSSQAQYRVLSLTIVGHAKGTSGMDDTLDKILLEVEVAISGDNTLGGKAVWVSLTSTEYEYADEIEQPLGQVTITYQVDYRVDATDPETFI